MGAWLSKKRPASEELETLSIQVKEFRRDIETMTHQRRSVLWYLSMVLFFTTTTSVAYILMKFEHRIEQIGYTCGSLFLGGLVLFLLRRLIDIVFDFRVRRKQSYLDGVIAKKKSLIEEVKEKETFKKAQEILAKYDDEYVDPQRSQPTTPSERRRAATAAGPSRTPILQGGPPMQAQLQGGPPMGMSTPMVREGPPPEMQGGPPMPMSAMSRPIMRGLQPGPGGAFRPRTLAPIRPFAQEAKTNMEKVVDYFFGDGPNSRLALICAQCHMHNGMAFPGEYDYLAYVCYACGHFNPARKMRTSHPAPSSALTTPALSRQPSTKSLVSSMKESETPGEEGSAEETSFERVSEASTDDEETETPNRAGELVKGTAD